MTSAPFFCTCKRLANLIIFKLSTVKKFKSTLSLQIVCVLYGLSAVNGRTRVTAVGVVAIFKCTRL